MKIKLLHEKAVVPKRATDGSAGFDLTSSVTCHINPMHSMPPTMVPTGIAVELPENYVGILALRSSMGRKFIMPLGVGVIDSDYRGEIMVPLCTHRETYAYLPVGTRLAQLIVVPCSTMSFEVVDELSPTARGQGGFGSTNA